MDSIIRLMTGPSVAQLVLQPGGNTLFASYVQLTQELLENVSGVCLLEGKLASLGEHGTLKARAVRSEAESMLPHQAVPRAPVSRSSAGTRLTLLPLEQTD